MSTVGLTCWRGGPFCLFHGCLCLHHFLFFVLLCSSFLLSSFSPTLLLTSSLLSGLILRFLTVSLSLYDAVAASARAGVADSK